MKRREMSDVTRWRRKMAGTAILWLCFVSSVLAGEEDGCLETKPSLHLKGNATIIALLDGHHGENCSSEIGEGLQQMAALAWTVNIINHHQLLPAIKLGVALYDGCSSSTAAQRALLTATVSQQGCARNLTLGLLTTPKIAKTLTSLTSTLQTPVTLTSDLTSTRHLSAAIARFLLANNWTTVNHLIIAPGCNLPLRLSLMKEAHHLGICFANVAQELQLPAELAGLVLVVGDMKDVEKTVALSAAEQNDTQFVFVSLDSDVRSLVDKLPERSLVMTLNPVLLRRPDASQKDVLASVDRNVFLDISAAVLDVSRCESHTCFTNALSKILSDENSVFYTVASVGEVNKTKTTEKIAEFVLNDSEMTYREYPGKFTPIANTPSKRCAAITASDSTSGVHFLASMSFREERWCAALVSLSALGALCCIAISLFLLVRRCQGDVLEGNPLFSFLLLFSLTLVYCSIIPHSVELPNESGVLCGVRIFSTCVSYALTFSIMLARSLMLASCDDEGGFMSHVNGYLQVVLCWFMFAVQLALSVQLLFLSPDQCAFYDNYMYLILHFYPAFLLLILLSSTPFIVHSKRNYREGVFFTSAAILSTLVWISWIAAYALLPDYGDAVVACGTTATATAILLSVFIPRTYLMMSNITRDNIAHALPELAYSTSSIVDPNYLSSTQNLTRQNHYSDQPRGHTNGDRENMTPENTYERYDSLSSPLKVTRF